MFRSSVVVCKNCGLPVEGLITKDAKCPRCGQYIYGFQVEDGEQEMKCPRCKSDKIETLHYKVIKGERKLEYYCMHCGFIFSEEVK